MTRTRIIPRLDVKGDRLVKGVHFEGLRQLGDPAEFARRYYDDGADELLYMDVVASLYGRNSLLELVERTATDVFIPITVGGGIRSCADIRAALRAGADRVAINTAALRDPGLLPAAASEFGASTIVVAIEAKLRGKGYEAYTDSGRERTGRDAVQWAIEASAHAGEILVSSIDRDGTGKGCDLALTRAIAEAVSVPVIAHGGIGSAADAAYAVAAGANGAAVASLLHYGKATITGLKGELAAAGVRCRRAA